MALYELSTLGSVVDVSQWYQICSMVSVAVAIPTDCPQSVRNCRSLIAFFESKGPFNIIAVKSQLGNN